MPLWYVVQGECITYASVIHSAKARGRASITFALCIYIHVYICYMQPLYAIQRYAKNPCSDSRVLVSRAPYEGEDDPPSRIGNEPLHRKRPTPRS